VIEKAARLRVLSMCVVPTLWLCRWRELKQQFDLKSHDAKLLSDGLKQSGHGQQLEEINQLEATIGQCSAGVLCHKIMRDQCENLYLPCGAKAIAFLMLLRTLAYKIRK